MTLEIGRGGKPAEVRIDYDRCTACGLCVQVCCGASLEKKDGRVVPNPAVLFGCFGCGQCMAVCPKGCIEVRGRDLSPDDLLDLPSPEGRASPDALMSLMLARRSIRKFSDRPVERTALDAIVSAASTAPMGVPPSEVGVLVFRGRDKVRAFRQDLLDALEGARWFFSPLMLALMRPFVGREQYALCRQFIAPVVETYLREAKAGRDVFFYDAPAALFFYGSGVADPTDPVIAATHAVLAAEAQGLGSCLLGFPGHIIQRHRNLKAKYHLPAVTVQGLAMVVGYPALKYRHAIRRRFARVEYIE